MESGGEDFVQAKRDAAERLRAKGLFAEALEAYLWCFDQGLLVDPSFYAVRLSFLLGDIKDLARVYPPAFDALRRRQAAASAHVAAGGWDVGALHELVALNRNLGEAEKTLSLFDELVTLPESASARATLLPFVIPMLVEARRYNEVVDAAADPESLLIDLVGNHEAALVRFRDYAERGHLDHESLESETRRIVDEVGLYCEALWGTQRYDEARRCADRLLAIHPRGWVFAAMIQHAVRAGAPAVARDFARRGLEGEVPEAERAVVAQAERQIPDNSGSG